MRRIFITGGTGFFGKSILDYLKRHQEVWPDAELTILSRDPRRFVDRNAALLAQDRKIGFVEGDVRDFRCAGMFDAVVHAATAAVTTLSDDEMYSTIVEGTRHVLDFAKSCGAGRILFTSSGAVYGPQAAAVSEDAACAPVTAYGRGKLAAEELCRASGIDAKIVRCFAFVGPYLNREIHYAIGNFIRDCIANRPIEIKGDGTPLRSYLYADDLVAWLFGVLEHGANGVPYNVGSPEGLSIRALAETVRLALGSTNEIVVRGMPVPGVRPAVYVPSVDRIRRELGLQMSVGLVEAIRKTAQL